MLTLQLNADYTPMKLVRWERAVELLLDEKVVTVCAWPGRFVRSPSLAVPWPAVIALRKYANVQSKVRFSARNVQARDHWTCVYCGVSPRHLDGRPDRSQLTLDHVVPRAQARGGSVLLPWSRKRVPVTCWENVVTACQPCNLRKADRTPMEAGMHMRQFPRVPTQADALRISLARLPKVPPEWEEFLPERVRAALLAHDPFGARANEG